MIKSAKEFIKLRKSRKPEEYNRANDEFIPDEVCYEVMKLDPEMKRSIAFNPSISLEIISFLADDEDGNIRFEIANKPNLTRELFEKFAKDPDESVRHRIAWNPHTPLDILESLTHDEWDVCAEDAKRKLKERLAPTVNPLKHDVYINRDKLMALILAYVPPTQKDIDKYGDDLHFEYQPLIQLRESAREIHAEALSRLEKFYQSHGAFIDFNMQEYKSNPESIAYGVLKRIFFIIPEELQPESIDVIKNFLNTPKGQEIEAWEKWESYWKKLDEITAELKFIK